MEKGNESYRTSLEFRKERTVNSEAEWLMSLISKLTDPVQRFSGFELTVENLIRKR